VTDTPTWTILIPTIGQRDALFRRLLERLLPQLDEQAGRVRVLAYWNNGGPALGEIRDDMVAAAATDYVSFIDDDDMVPEFFVAECMTAMAGGPDKVGFRVGYHVDGKLEEVADQSIRHGGWHRDAAGVLCRDITHIGPIRTDIARRGLFRRAGRGKAEDRVWVKQVRPYVKTEVYIDKIMYDYLWSPTGTSWQRPDSIRQVGERPTVEHPYFTWHEGTRLRSASARRMPASMYKPIRGTEWHDLLPFGVDVEASYALFDEEAGFTQEYAGLGIWKTVDDMARYRKIIEETKPEVVVETGTRWGGFAAWLAGEFGVDVITVDVDVDTRPDEWPNVTFVVGDAKDDDTVAAVRELVAGRRTMVSLDDDHHAPHVEAEIKAYAPLVSPGCYLVVEDGLADIVTSRRARRIGQQIPKTGGPLKAIARALYGDLAWTRDRAVEEMTPLTHHPAGFWVRNEAGRP